MLCRRAARYLSVAVVLSACQHNTDPKDTDSDQGADTGQDTDATDSGAPSDRFAGVTPSAHYFAAAADITWSDPSGASVSLSDIWAPGTTVIFRFFSKSSQDQALVQGDIAALIEASPRDVHYVFGAYGTKLERKRALDTLQASIDSALNALGPKRAETWRSRLHLVSTPPRGLDWFSSLGAPNVRRIASHDGMRFIGAAIDPDQHIRPLGELVDWAQSKTRLEWLAHDAIFYAREHRLRQRMAADGATEIVLYQDAASGTGWGGAGIPTTVTLPDLSGFERAELALNMSCFEVTQDADDGSAKVGDLDCPEWDRITSLQLCSDVEATACTTELGRWITPYTREGLLVHDITPLLPLLSAGEQSFRYIAIDNHKITLTLRLINDDTLPRPISATPLFTGGQLTAETNARYTPIEVTIPENAVRTEVAAVITGHSFGKDTANCAEFCNHQHHFSIGDTSVVESNPQAGTGYGCESEVANGVIANQYGSWPYGRGGWCPGSAVDLFRGDLTAAARPGSSVSISYRVTVDGKEYNPTWLDPNDPSKVYEGEGVPPGIWVPEIDMSSWLVSYAAPAQP